MRREELFNRSGYYRFLLDSNVLLHRQAAETAIAAVAPLIRRHDPNEPVRVLDLACGGWPMAIAGVMGAFPEQAFEYTGVDINPDQVELAGNLFEFPSNVLSVRILEGNAWDLRPLRIPSDCEVIFSGMNLHHGNPQELLYLSRQLRELPPPDGLLFSHDVYRPDAQPYLRRPDVNPDDASESFRLIDAVRIAAADTPAVEFAQDVGPGDPSWRRDYLERMRRTLIARGGDPDGTASTVAHMRQRDFPVSTQELTEILATVGFSTEVRRFDDTSEPMGPYVACCVAYLR